MAINKEIKYALDYHEATKHSEASLMTSRHYLDFDNKPIPFKIYAELPSIALPINFPTPKVNAISCIASKIHQKPSYGTKGAATATTMASTENSTTRAKSIPKLDVEDLAE